MDKAVTDLPEPLSPTMATSSPLFTENEFDLTATDVLPSDTKWILSPSILNSGSILFINYFDG
jgi:hypothetical protein